MKKLLRLIRNIWIMRRPLMQFDFAIIKGMIGDHDCREHEKNVLRFRSKEGPFAG